MEIINNYETIFIVNPDLDEEKTNAVVDKIKALIESAGTIDAVDVWGKRKLAYEIAKKTEATTCSSTSHRRVISRQSSTVFTKFLRTSSEALSSESNAIYRKKVV